MGKIKEIFKRKYLVKRVDGGYDQHKFETDADLVKLENGLTLNKTNFTQVIGVKFGGEVASNPGGDIVHNGLWDPLPFEEAIGECYLKETDYAKLNGWRITAKKEGIYHVYLGVHVSDTTGQMGTWHVAVFSTRGLEYENYVQTSTRNPHVASGSAGGVVYLKKGESVWGYLCNPTGQVYRLDGRHTKLVMAPYCLYE